MGVLSELASDPSSERSERILGSRSRAMARPNKGGAPRALCIKSLTTSRSSGVNDGQKKGPSSSSAKVLSESELERGPYVGFTTKDVREPHVRDKGRA